MEKDDGILGQLGDPAFEIFLDVFVKVPPVDMQKIDAAIGDIGQGFGKGLAQERGEAAVHFVLLQDGLIDLFTIVACMLVTLPGIDRNALRRQPC